MTFAREAFGIPIHGAAPVFYDFDITRRVQTVNGAISLFRSQDTLAGPAASDIDMRL